jgi:endo-1,4-beta-xylanase
VVNEAFNDDGSMRDTIWYDQPGIGFAGTGTKYIEQVLNWAHAADPSAKLFYNDYNAEPVDAKSDAIYAMAQDFRTLGVPLDGHRLSIAH